METVQLVSLLILLPCHFVMSSASSSTSPSEDRIQQLESVSKQLARQLMLQQLYVDEKTRSEGDSGIKQVDYPARVMLRRLAFLTCQNPVHCCCPVFRILGLSNADFYDYSLK